MVRYFIESKVLSVFLLVFIIVAGGYSFLNIKKELYPDNESRFFTVETIYQNYPAEIVEKIVTKPLEGYLSALSGVKRLVANSESGRSRIFISFNRGPLYKTILTDLYEAVDSFSLNIPSDCRKPSIANYDANERPEFSFSLSSDSISTSELRRICEEIVVNKIKQVPGVAKTEVFGSSLSEVKIKLNSRFLKLNNVSHRDVHRAVAENNIFIKVSELNSDMHSYPLYVDHRVVSKSQIEEIAVGDKKIKDIAEVVITPKDAENISRINGAENISVAIYINKNANLLETGRRLDEVLSQVRQKLLKTTKGFVEWQEIGSKYRDVKKELTGLGFQLLVGCLLVFVFSLLSLKSLKISWLILLSIPFSVGGLMVVLFMFDEGLNLYTILGAAIGSGMLVDASVIIIENLLEGKSDSSKNILKGLEKIYRPVLLGILTTLIIFVPVFFAPESLAASLRSIALSVCISLTFSLMFSLLILPRLFFIFIKNDVVTYSQWNSGKKWYSTILMRMFPYSRILKRAIFFVLLGIFFSVLVLATVESEMTLPEKNLHVIYEFPPGTKLSVMDNYTTMVVGLMRESIDNIAMVGQSTKKYRSVISVTPIRRKDRAQKYRELVDFIDNKIPQGYPGFLRIDEPVRTKDKGEIIVIDFFGNNYKLLTEMCRKSGKSVIRSPLVRGVMYHYRDDMKEYNFIPDYNKLIARGLTPADIAEQINMKRRGYVADKYTVSNARGSCFLRDIIIIGDDSGRTISDVQKMDIKSDTGNIKLHTLGEILSSSTVSSRQRINRNKSLSISVEGQPGVSLSLLNAEISRHFSRLDFPDRYFYELRIDEKDKDLPAFIVFYILFALYLIYYICASVYRSFITPFLIFKWIVISLLAPLLLIAITGGKINIPILIALGVMIGMGVNNIILVIEQFQLVKDKKKLTLIKLIFKKRKSIMISSFSTLFALLPGLFGFNRAYFQISLVLIIGIIWNVISVMILFPLFESGSQRLRGLFRL